MTQWCGVEKEYYKVYLNDRLVENISSLQQVEFSFSCYSFNKLYCYM